MLNCCVTETNATLCRSKVSMIRAKSSRRAAQPVDLVDDDAVDLAGFDVGQQALEGRAVHVAAGEPTVVVALGQAPPALVRLALDVGLGRFSLGVRAS